ncbi:conjugative transfer protein MobI(A/C) [Marinobacterium aestuariivivens]|uniref:Conjugative transfer protein MobI(A/C) n=1 Tax=Marinobacterium aestuariivivens TaxID=1698799 RepID=A0ABW2AAB9_9GAMM
MFRTLEELEELLQNGKEAERQWVRDPELLAESKEFLRTVRAMIDREQRVIALDGLKLADSYWEANRDAREEDDEPCYLGTRVRIVKGTLHFEWFRNNARQYLGEGKPKQIFSTYLRKGRGSRYSDSHFQNEPKWARDQIGTVEDGYELLRKRATLLSAIKKNLRDYEKILAECFDDGPASPDSKREPSLQHEAESGGAAQAGGNAK